MEILIFLVWFCLVWIIPITFVVSAYAAYLNGRSLKLVIPLLAAAMGVFLWLSLQLIGPMFQGFFWGGEPAYGRFAGPYVYIAMVAGYAFFGWLMSSAIVGSLVVPGRRLLRPANSDQ